MSIGKITVREACRRRMPLDGADAQALEGALQQADAECIKLKTALAAVKAERDTALAACRAALEQWKTEIVEAERLRKIEDSEQNWDAANFYAGKIAAYNESITQLRAVTSGTAGVDYKAKYEEAVELLREVEWVRVQNRSGEVIMAFCPACGMDAQDGHGPRCAYPALLEGK